MLERAQQRVVEHALQVGGAGGDLQHAAEHVGGVRVVPRGSRLVLQRQRREAVGEGRIVEVLAEEAVGGERALRRAVAEIGVGEAGGVAQQVLHRRRRSGGRARAVGVQHVEVGEGGDEVGDRLVEPQQTALGQHQGRCRDQHLGHGEDAPHRILAQRIARRDVAEADAAPPQHAVASADQHVGAGDRPGLDVGGETVPETCEPPLVEARSAQPAAIVRRSPSSSPRMAKSLAALPARTRAALPGYSARMRR